MASHNYVSLIGNLTRDPENRYTSGGSGVCEMGIAVNEKYKKDGQFVEKVGFFSITAWGRLAETCGEYLKKGSSIFVSGKLDYQTWEKDGEKKSKVGITASRIEFLDRKTQEAESEIPF